MPVTAADTMNNEILFKTYSYANGKYEEQAVYKKDVMKISLDKVEISKDSPEYETICSQMRSMEGLGAVGLNNLFYDSNEIMYDYYEGKLTQDDLKKLVKDYLYYSVGEAEENNAFQQKRVTAILSRLYEMFTRGNVRNAANQNHKEGQQFLKEIGLEGATEFYYNSKWYYACEDIQKLLKEIVNELSDEYGAEQVNFEEVIENTAYTLAGGLSFNGVWNWMNWQTNRPSPLGENNYLFLYMYKQYSPSTIGSYFLDKNNWNISLPEKDIYTKTTDILKKCNCSVPSSYDAKIH